MSDKKAESKLGFKTTAMDLQGKHEELFSFMRGKSNTWNELLDACKTVQDRHDDDKQKPTDTTMHLANINFEQCLLIMFTICKLGRDVADIGTQIAELRKSTDKLNLKVK